MIKARSGHDKLPEHPASPCRVWLINIKISSILRANSDKDRSYRDKGIGDKHYDCPCDSVDILPIRLPVALNARDGKTRRPSPQRHIKASDTLSSNVKYLDGEGGGGDWEYQKDKKFQMVLTTSSLVTLKQRFRLGHPFTKQDFDGTPSKNTVTFVAPNVLYHFKEKENVNTSIYHNFDKEGLITAVARIQSHVLEDFSAPKPLVLPLYHGSPSGIIRSIYII
ncbi:hypothetical protein E2C01_008170 [Portunus trituberculatus]|uniref:Uncharacterized protein n=1 Tax=Portunus trituberculatus TaxID=210409 RepID=A0A5B7D0X3_PORTR|nr:hypothetical protein [Portunus trituberculatus]